MKPSRGSDWALSAPSHVLAKPGRWRRPRCELHSRRTKEKKKRMIGVGLAGSAQGSWAMDMDMAHGKATELLHFFAC